MRKGLVIETFFKEEKQNFYYLILPDLKDDGFYRTIRSFSGFFQSVRNPHANVTEIRQFTYHDHREIEFKKDFYRFNKTIDWDNLKTFESLWSFYDFIGYNYKTRKYKSGEVLKSFKNGRFILPKKRK